MAVPLVVFGIGKLDLTRRCASDQSALDRGMWTAGCDGSAELPGM